MHQQFLEKAISLAEYSVNHHGGPFGAVIVLNNEIIAEGYNQVTQLHDPTAHAEIVSIRAAGQNIGSHDLKQSTLYSSCEPCPMCLAASYWANIGQIYFAADRFTAENAGFIDAELYSEFQKPHHSRRLPIEHINCTNAEKPFQLWQQEANKIRY